MRACGVKQWQRFWMLGLVLMCPQWVWAQQAGLPIQNPLIRPPTLSSEQAGKAAPSGGSAGSAAKRTNSGGESEGADSPELRAKAATRLTQEDLNVQQQALNAGVIPIPLQQLFTHMYVAAHARGAIVLRRFDVKEGQSAAASGGESTTGTQTAGRAAVSGAPATNSNVLLGFKVLRFPENRVMNINGYSLKASLDGAMVSVDWQDERGRWVNVFLGAVESASGSARIPAASALEKPDKKVYEYLTPKLSSQTTSSGGTGSGGNNNNSNSNLNGSSSSSGTSSSLFSN